MLPTLSGRIQTRILVLAVIGSLVTLLVTPLLPGIDDLAAGYRVTFRVLGLVIVLGVAWELIYHGLQQFRWEKDWPTVFGLLTAVPEGLLVWTLLAAGAVPGAEHVPGAAFVIDFAAVWSIVWLWVSGPMRVPFIRWRFRGGRIV